MAPSLLCSFLLLLLLAVATVSHANLAAKIYWQTKLPNTPMPAAIRELLRPEINTVDDKSAAVIGKDGIEVTSSKDPFSYDTYAAGSGGEKLKKDPFNYDMYATFDDKLKKDPFGYITYAEFSDHLSHIPDDSLVFLEKNLRPGTHMKLHFFKSQTKSTFLPRLVADSIPFSTAEIDAILKKFSIKPGSPMAKAVKETLENCEVSGAYGDAKTCATSLESMVDFATSELATTNLKVISTSMEKETVSQYFTIGSKIEKMRGSNPVSCHIQNYAYAIFMCHQTRATSTYMVPLVGKDGIKVQAVAICHQDTSKWNPNHFAFQVLKAKPGTVPVCHFLTHDHIVWVPST